MGVAIVGLYVGFSRVSLSGAQCRRLNRQDVISGVAYYSSAFIFLYRVATNIGTT